MKSKLSILALSLFVIQGAYAAQESTQQIECKDACVVTQDDVGCDRVKVTVSDSKKAELKWSDGTDNSSTYVETGSLTDSGVSKKHVGYTVYSGGSDDGSSKILFELPTDLVGKTEPVRFTGYFYDLENDGGPDVPLGFTLNCTVN
jgi:hypothetical protein